MADEAVLAVPNLGKLDYTLKHYLKYAQKMKEKANQLSALRELMPSLFNWKSLPGLHLLVCLA